MSLVETTDRQKLYLSPAPSSLTSQTNLKSVSVGLTPFVWDMERNFAQLKAEHAELNHVTGAIERHPEYAGDVKEASEDAHNEKS